MQPVFTIKEALSFGWKKAIENIWFLAALSLVFLVLSFAFGGVTGGLKPVFQLLNIFVSYLAMFTLVKVSLHIYRGEKPTTADVFQIDWPKFGLYALAAIISSIITGVGFILLVLPGIYLAVRLSLAGFAVIADGIRPIDALKKSLELTRYRFWQLFGLSLILGLINIAAGILFGIGLLITMPMSVLVLVYVYEKIKSAPVVAAAVPPTITP